MRNVVRMTARSLRDIMGESFDFDEYEQGRSDAHRAFQNNPDLKDAKIEEIKRILENAEFRNRPGPSYWVGAMCEADFTWPTWSKKMQKEGQG